MGRLLHALSYMITDHLILLNYNKYTPSVHYADYNLTRSSDCRMIQCA